MKYKHTWQLIMLLFVLLFMPPFTAIAADDIRVFVNGTQMSFPDQKPLINADNRTLVPIRFISEALGASVEWCDVEKKVTIEHQGKTIALLIGEKKATVGTSTITLDTAASIINSRTMVPLRFISEGLGANVEWDGDTRTIYITTGADQPLSEAKPYQGTPYSQSGLPATLKGAGSFKDPDAQNMVVTVNDLPIKVSSILENIVYEVTFGQDTIDVKQKNTSPFSMFIAEHGTITRFRNNDVTTRLTADTFICHYSVHKQTEIADGMNALKIEDVSHVIFETLGDNSVPFYLTVPNPGYKG